MERSRPPPAAPPTPTASSASTLPGLGAGRNYQLEAKSPIDGSTKRSDVLTATGRYTFTVGNAPLQRCAHERPERRSAAQHEDHRVGAAGNRQAAVRLRSASPTPRAAPRSTSTGLGSGRIYVLSVVPYNTGTVYSDDLRAPGQYDFRVGGVEVTAIKTLDNTPHPLPGRQCERERRRRQAHHRGVRHHRRERPHPLRPAGLKAGKTYVLEAKSPLDGSIKRSQDITANGKYVFQVGNPPVIVTLRNALSGQPLAGVSIAAREKLSTGTLKWIRQVTTDAAGQAIFDLDGLGHGPHLSLHLHAVQRRRPSTATWSPSPEHSTSSSVRWKSRSSAAPPVRSCPGADVAAIELLANNKGKVGPTRRHHRRRRHHPLRSARARQWPHLRTRHQQPDRRQPQAHRRTHADRQAHVRRRQQTAARDADERPEQGTVADTDITAYELLANGDTPVDFAVHDRRDGRRARSTSTVSARIASTSSPQTRTTRAGVDTPPIAAPGDGAFRVGTVPVTLVDGDNNVPMAGDRNPCVREDGRTASCAGPRPPRPTPTASCSSTSKASVERHPDRTVAGASTFSSCCNPFGVDKTLLQRPHRPGGPVRVPHHP